MSRKTVPWVLAAALSLILLVMFMMWRNNRASQLPTISPSPSAIPTEVNEPQRIGQMLLLPGASALYVADQQPGDMVTVSTVFFAEPGYVVIHKLEAGEAGEIIGVSEFVEGSKDMITVNLDEPLVNEMEYIAMLHKDDGNGEWDGAEVDGPLTFEEKPVMMNFMASDEAEEAPAVAF